MNRHRRLLLLVAASLCAAPLPGHTQQTLKAKRIGILSPESGDFGPVPPFRQELRQLGWLEEKSLVIDHRWANGRYERLPELMAELLTTSPDVIYAIGPDAARIAKEGTRTVPIVVLDLETDPIASGFGRPLAISRHSVGSQNSSPFVNYRTSSFILCPRQKRAGARR